MDEVNIISATAVNTNISNTVVNVPLQDLPHRYDDASILAIDVVVAAASLNPNYSKMEVDEFTEIR